MRDEIPLDGLCGCANPVVGKGIDKQAGCYDEGQR